MNKDVRIPKGMLKVGTSLAHDVHDGSGKLLLRRGTLLDSEVVVQRLENAGFFDPEAIVSYRSARESAEREIPAGYVPDRTGTAFSVFTELHSACERLQAVFSDRQRDLEKEVLALCEVIRECYAVDGDASLSALFLPQPFADSAGHPVRVAMLTHAMLTRQKHEASRIPSALAAALTMNIDAPERHDELFFGSGVPSDVERARIRAHPGASVEALLARGIRTPLWLAIVTEHHEAFDGSGVPAGLKGEKILPEAQVIALADRYCAMVHGIAHGDPPIPAQVIRDIHAHHGAAISPTLMGVLVATIGIYPPGTCVRLANGETAVVVHRLGDPKHPVVYAVSDPSGTPYDAPRKRLTSSQPAFAIQLCVRRADVKASVVPESLWPPTVVAKKHAPTS
jgi:hypothetical protein